MRTCSISSRRSVELERRAEREQLVQGQAQGVDVGAAVALASEPLGGHESQRAQDVAGLRQAVVSRLRQPEVGDPGDAVGVQEQVRRLDVAVDDPPGMGIGQPPGHLPADLRHAPEERLPTPRGPGHRDRAAPRPHGRGCRDRRDSRSGMIAGPVPGDRAESLRGRASHSARPGRQRLADERFRQERPGHPIDRTGLGGRSGRRDRLLAPAIGRAVPGSDDRADLRLRSVAKTFNPSMTRSSP